MNLYWTGLVIIPSSPNKKSKKTQVFRCHQNNISYSLVQGVMLRNRINMSMIDLDRFSCIGVSTGYLGLFESQNRIYNQPSPKSAVNHSFQKNKNRKHFPIPQVFPQPKHTQTKKNTHTHTHTSPETYHPAGAAQRAPWWRTASMQHMQGWELVVCGPSLLSTRLLQRRGLSVDFDGLQGCGPRQREGEWKNLPVWRRGWGV